MAVNKVVYGSETLIDLTEDTVTADTVADGYSVHLASGVRTVGTAKYAASPEANGNAVRTNGIPFAKVDSTSTSTKFTATVPGITEYYDGLTVMLYNGKVTSASGYTININGLGAYGTYSNMALGNPTTPTDPTRDTTIFSVNYAMIFVFYTNIAGAGTHGWICYRGYDANTNTIGYQLRTNSSTMPMKQITYRYRLLFTSLDGLGWVPANTSSSTNATASRTVNQAVIDPFGEIVYYGTTASVSAGSNPSAAALWQEYTLSLGYSFNRTGAALVLPYPKPIYIKCAPQSGGGAVIDADNPYVFALPSTEDGKIYIYLGRTYSATNIELTMNHPVYYYKDGSVRLWTDATAGLTSVDWDDIENKPTFATVATSGSYNDLSNKPTIPTVPTNVSSFTNDAGYLTSSTGVTSFNGSTGAVTYTAPVTSVNGSTGAVTVNVPSAATANPVMDGTAAVGSSTKYAKEDHVHPSDSSKLNWSGSSTSSGVTYSSDIQNAGKINLNTSTSGANGNAQISPSESYISVANSTRLYAEVVITPTNAKIGAGDGQSRVTNYITLTPSSTTINNVVTPTQNGDAANKQYVDNAISGISTLPSVSSSDNGKVLMVVSGSWAAASLPTYNGGVS